MIRFIFLRFWPVFLPLLLYAAWIWWRQHKARKTGQPVPAFKDGPWFWAVLVSMLLAIIGFIALGLSHSPSDGAYIPAHVEGDHMVPAQVVPRGE